jgi:hypothetical protein
MIREKAMRAKHTLFVKQGTGFTQPEVDIALLDSPQSCGAAAAPAAVVTAAIYAITPGISLLLLFLITTNHINCFNFTISSIIIIIIIIMSRHNLLLTDHRSLKKFLREN